MGFFDSIAINNKINKLKNYKSDLGDDSSSVRYYNEKIDNLISDFQSFIKSGHSGVTNKLYDYKEPYQDNDSNLSSARSYIQSEIKYLNKQLSDEKD